MEYTTWAYTSELPGQSIYVGNNLEKLIKPKNYLKQGNLNKEVIEQKQTQAKNKSLNKVKEEPKEAWKIIYLKV